MAIMKLKPKDQLQLSNEELRRKMPPRILYPQNPRAPKNLTLYSFKDKMFKKDEQIEQTAFHLVVDGALLHIESQEALDQEDFWRQKEEEDAKRKSSESVDITIEDDSHQNAEDEGRVLRNQFHYADRVSQTATKTIRERGVATKPPVTIPFSGTANPWIIYDAYVEELAKQNGNDADQKGGHLLKAKDQNSSEGRTPERTGDLFNFRRLKWAAKLTERVVNHNTESELYENFKSKEHPIWKKEGSSVFVPLWRFQFSKVKKKDVTALKWNPKYTDLFAAGFGNYEFQKQSTGYVCCYSLKNTLFPEYFWKTESAVCSLDWHPHNPSLLAVGLYDGTVVVFDVQSKTREPTHGSTVKVNKHTDPVWDVRWENDNSNSTLQFYSVSEDGRVTSWSLMKNKLESEEVTLLKLDNVHIGSNREAVVTDPTALISQAAGTCFDFHPTQPHIFVVGTCEGRIFKCSKNYSGQYLQTYEGHEMSVTALQWNPFHPRIFISSSSDWTVKLWDHTTSAPLLVFDVGVAVGDVQWAPYSSTIFAAAPADGTVHLYDLEVNRRARVGSYKIPHEPCLTKLAFNTHNTILIVGEAGGTVSTLKLSPTLNTPLEPVEGMTEAQLRTEKLNTVFSMVSELFKSPQAGNQNLPGALQGVCESNAQDTEADTHSS